MLPCREGGAIRPLPIERGEAPRTNRVGGFEKGVLYSAPRYNFCAK